jgi:phosphoribosylanthranilate isomerase
MAAFEIKICGLSTPETMATALDASATMVGLVFHRKSPRSVSLELAAELAAQARGRATIVALTVNPSDEGIEAIMQKVQPDLIQLHGSETPERVAEVKALSGVGVLKAFGVSTAADLAPIPAYKDVAGYLLLDARPPVDAAYPGGHGKPFDWAILKALPADIPIVLSGGLTVETVATAIRTLRDMGVRLHGVDVSSGVERAPGVKDEYKIRAFIANAQKAANA